MSAANNIFRNDWSNMGSAVPLSERVSNDPKVLDEVAFRDAHGGMNRPTWAARAANWRADNEQVGTLSDLQGDPPKFETKLSPQRARYAQYSQWLFGEKKKLAELEQARARFEAMVAAPDGTEAEIRGLVRRAADRLLGRNKDGPLNGTRKKLDDKLTEQKHAAEAAREALPDLEKLIEIAQLRVRHLSSRQDEFLNPALIEVAEDSGLGQLYADRLREFREVFDLIAGLGAVAGEYGVFGFNRIECVVKVDGDLRLAPADTVNFPAPDFKSLRADEADFTIEAGGRMDVWTALRQSLILDPSHKAYIPLPK